MIEITISTLDEGQKLKKLCFKYFDKAPQSFTYKMLRKKNIVLNNKKASGDEILTAGDSVRFYLSDETISMFHTSQNGHSSGNSKNKAGKKSVFRLTSANIIYECDDYIIINKPAGVLSQKAVPEDYSVNEAVIDYMLDKNMITEEQLEAFRPSVCNRLDRNTSGIITAGKTLKGLQFLSDKLKEKGKESTVVKSYLAIVHGRFDKDGIITLCFSKSEKDNIVRVSEVQSDIKKISIKTNNQSKLNCEYIRDDASHNNSYNELSEKSSDIIQTGFKFIDYNKTQNLSLVEAVLYTGKSHQIRASLEYLGFPIVGDRKYGNSQLDRELKPRPKRQLLHAAMLQLSENEIFKADIPADFAEYTPYNI